MGASQSACCGSRSSAYLDDTDEKDWKCADVAAHDYSSQPPSREQMRSKSVSRNGRTKLQKQNPTRGRSASTNRSRQEPWTPSLTRTPSRGRSLEARRLSVGDKDRAARLAELKAGPPLAYRPPRNSSLQRSRSHSRPGTAPNGSVRHREQIAADRDPHHHRPRRSRTLHSRRVSTPIEFEMSPNIMNRIDIETTTRQVHAAATARPPPRHVKLEQQPSLTHIPIEAHFAELPASPVPAHLKVTVDSRSPVSEIQDPRATATSSPSPLSLAPPRPMITTFFADPTPSTSSRNSPHSTISPASNGSVSLPPTTPLPNRPRKKSFTTRAIPEPTLPSIDALAMNLPALSPLEALTRTAGSPHKPDYATREATRQRLIDQQRVATAMAVAPVATRDIPVRILPLYGTDPASAAHPDADADVDLEDKDDAASLSTSTSSTRSSLSLPPTLLHRRAQSPALSLSAFPATPASSVAQAYSLFPRQHNALAHVPSWMDLGPDMRDDTQRKASRTIAQRGRGVVVDHGLRHVGPLVLKDQVRAGGA